MFTGPVGPVEIFFYWPEAVFWNFYWPGAIGLPLASSPGYCKKKRIMLYCIGMDSMTNDAPMLYEVHTNICVIYVGADWIGLNYRNNQSMM